MQVSFTTSSTRARSLGARSVSFASASGVTHFKVFIESIYPAQSATLSSTGPMNPSGELQIYAHPGTLPNPSSFDGVAAAADTADYVDLMDPTALAQLAGSGTVTRWRIHS